MVSSTGCFPLSGLCTTQSSLGQVARLTDVNLGDHPKSDGTGRDGACPWQQSGRRSSTLSFTRTTRGGAPNRVAIILRIGSILTTRNCLASLSPWRLPRLAFRRRQRILGHQDSEKLIGNSDGPPRREAPP